MKKLQECFPDHELKTVRECIATLKWSAEHKENDERGTGEITCDCGEKVSIEGCIGPDIAYCKSCRKGMQNATGLIMAGNSYAVHIDYDNTKIPEDGKVWFTFDKDSTDAKD